nr:hypothetical protein GCM10020063_102960 [Dactylosporangium thailandense]
MRAFVLRWRLVELIAGLGALALLPRARTLLPAKYFYDGDYIAALNAGTVLQLALVVAAVGLALRPAARWSTMPLAAAAIGLGGVYLTRVPAWARAAPLVAAGALPLYGALFRSYWLVIAALFAAAYAALRRGRRQVLLPPVAAAMFVVAAAGTLVLRHDSLDTFRAAANAGRAGSPVTPMLPLAIFALATGDACASR